MYGILIPDRMNGLTKRSAVDVLQLRGIDQQRFVHKLGAVSLEKMKFIVTAIAAIIEYEST